MRTEKTNSTRSAVTLLTVLMMALLTTATAAFAGEPAASRADTDAPRGLRQGDTTLELCGRPIAYTDQVGITYLMPEDGTITLTVIGSDGSLVRTISRQPAAAGRHLIYWDSRDDAGMRVPNGTYYLALHVDGATESTSAVVATRVHTESASGSVASTGN